jgi:hypothetical protein
MQVDLEPNETIRMAAEWLAGESPHVGRAIVPEIKQRFGLTALDAIEVIRRAQTLRWGRAS